MKTALTGTIGAGAANPVFRTIVGTKPKHGIVRHPESVELRPETRNLRIHPNDRIGV